ncbi:AraC family transcriptional regulator, partial [Cohnella sp.]|uniref:AraC family transcriptional regulator n=1 Tax=Cohnella sp. TaxID=1883426 RepID=UPI0037041326
MNINDLIASWNYASCKVIDIRRITIKAGDSIRSYRVPSSLFLMSIRGNATVHLGQDFYDMQHFTVIHAGKGNVLDIDAGMQDLDYYSIYYKGGVQPLAPSDIASRSFDLSYSITPNNPMPLYRIVSEMEKEWGRSNTLTRLRVGTLFYQFVYELLHQLPKQGLNSKKRDLATQIATIVHENYAEAMTLETLSESLNYSVSHLSSYFRLRTGISPIDYLIKVRIDQAAKLLLETDATLKEIAAGVGYHDPSYFSRLFKKHRGVSPIRYREVNAKEQKQVDSPPLNVEFSIVSSELVRYADDIDNYYHHEGDGEEDLFMFKDSRTTLVSALLLSFILLLSACGTNDALGTTTSQPSPSDAPVSSEQPQTKLVQTINGEIEIPTQPKRIVAGEYLGSLIALGVTPVGTSDHHIKNPYFNQYLKDVENIGDGNGNVEKILSLKPDLIIMDDFYPELNEQMSKIAPTVVIPYASLKTV